MTQNSRPVTGPAFATLLCAAALSHAHPVAPKPAQAASAAAPAASSAASAKASQPAWELPQVQVKGKALRDFGGSRHVHEHMLKRAPVANGDLNRVLKANPQVQFDKTQQSGQAQGELTPANISINGAKFYQNQFLLDGVSLNNDLNPSGSSNDPRRADAVSGGPLGMSVDKDVVCELEVHDSNVSARYGGFTGGVVQAHLCEAGLETSARVSLELSNSAWSHLFIDPKRGQAFKESNIESNQPIWRKQRASAVLQTRPAEGLGLMMYATRQASVIPLRALDKDQAPGRLPEFRDQTREMIDLLARLDWRPQTGALAGQHGWLTLRHAPGRDELFTANGLDTDFEIKRGGQSLSGGWEHRSAGLNLRHAFSHVSQQQTRDSEHPYYRTWMWSQDKSWGNPKLMYPSFEGTWPNIHQAQRNTAYSLTLDQRETWQAMGAQHQLAGGIELARRSASYGLPQDHLVYDLQGNGLMETRTCTDAQGRVDDVDCSLAPTLRTGKGQALARRTLYRAGEMAVNSGQAAGWLELRTDLERLSLRSGLRLDRDELASEATLAPRLAASWALNAEASSQLTAGLNRYYGRTFFNAALLERSNTLKLLQERGANLLWADTREGRPTHRVSELRVPYDDEWTVGYQSHGEVLHLEAKYVHRQSRDGLMLVSEKDKSGQFEGTGPKAFTNEGRGSAEVLSLIVEGHRSLRWANTFHQWSVALNRSQTRSNFSGDTSEFGALGSDPWVIYQGERMRLSDRPIDNFNRPWTARLSLASEMPGLDLSLQQFVLWQAGSRRIAKTGTVLVDGAPHDKYEDVDLGATAAWDVSLTWQPQLGRHRPWLMLTVENLTNRRNDMLLLGGLKTYEKGRTFSLQLGYEI